MTEKIKYNTPEKNYYEQQLDSWTQTHADNLRLLNNANNMISRLPANSQNRIHWERVRDDALTALERSKINIEHYQMLLFAIDEK